MERVSLALVALTLTGCAGTKAPGAREPARRETRSLTVRAERPACSDEEVRAGRPRAPDARRISVTFDATPVAQALDFIRDAAGINLAISASAQERLDAERPTVTLRLHDVSVGAVLRHVLDADDQLVGEAREDLLVVTTRGSLKRRSVTAFYEISELVQRRPNYTAPTMGLPDVKKAPTGIICTWGAEEEQRAVGYDADRLVELVQLLLEPGDSVEVAGSQLVVRASPSTQEKVVARLQGLR